MGSFQSKSQLKIAHFIILANMSSASPFECPICYRAFTKGMFRPVTVCPNGHFLCEVCAQSFPGKTCPECRAKAISPFAKVHPTLMDLMDLPDGRLDCVDVLEELLVFAPGQSRVLTPDLLKRVPAVCRSHPGFHTLLARLRWFSKLVPVSGAVYRDRIVRGLIQCMNLPDCNDYLAEMAQRLLYRCLDNWKAWTGALLRGHWPDITRLAMTMVSKRQSTSRLKHIMTYILLLANNASPAWPPLSLTFVRKLVTVSGADDRDAISQMFAKARFDSDTSKCMAIRWALLMGEWKLATSLFLDSVWTDKHWRASDFCDAFLREFDTDNDILELHNPAEFACGLLYASYVMFKGQAGEACLRVGQVSLMLWDMITLHSHDRPIRPEWRGLFVRTAIRCPWTLPCEPTLTLLADVYGARLIFHPQCKKLRREMFCSV